MIRQPIAKFPLFFYAGPIALISAGFKHIDAVSFVSSKAVPQMADSEAVLKELDPPDDVELHVACRAAVDQNTPDLGIEVCRGVVGHSISREAISRVDRHVCLASFRGIGGDPRGPARALRRRPSDCPLSLPTRHAARSCVLRCTRAQQSRVAWRGHTSISRGTPQHVDRVRGRSPQRYVARASGGRRCSPQWWWCSRVARACYRPIGPRNCC